MSVPAFAQQDLTISVKKPCPITREFTYQGKPVSPEALIGFFQIMSDETYSDTASLTLHPYRSHTLHDTIMYQERSYCERKWSYMSYLNTETSSFNLVAGSSSTSFKKSYIAYCLRQNTKDNKFLVEAAYYTGGTITYRCMFRLDIKGDKLIKMGSICMEDWMRFSNFDIINDLPSIRQDSRDTEWIFTMDSIHTGR